MPSFNIDGLASGLNTSQLINQLMSAERIGLNRHQSRRDEEARRLSAWQEIDAKLATLHDAAKALAKGTALGATKATSSNETLVKATSTATTSRSVTLAVRSLAAAHQLAWGGLVAGQLTGAGRAVVGSGLSGVGASLADASDLNAGTHTIEVVATSGATATIRLDGHEQTVASSGAVDLVDGSGRHLVLDASTLRVGQARVAVLETTATTTTAAFAAALNGASAGVSASVIDRGDSSATPAALVLSASATGTAAALSVDLSGVPAFAGASPTVLRAAADAEIDLGGGLTATRGSNRISDLVEGVTLDLLGAAPGQEVRVEVTADQDKNIATVRQFVDSLNAVLATMRKHTAVDPAGRSNGVLAGDSRVARVADTLRDRLRTTVEDGSLQVLQQIGISLKQEGSYALDETKLRAALADDADAVSKLLAGTASGTGATGGVADVLSTGIGALRGSGGPVSSAQETTRSRIAARDSDIAAYQKRLVLVETRYRRQFSDLETALRNLNAQSSQLAQMLAG